MEIDLYWYLNGTNNKWMHDLSDHLMVHFETLISLASMTYIAELDAYILHPRDENDFHDFTNES